MTGLTQSRPKARLIYAAVLVGSLCACKTGGGGSAGDNVLDPVTACLSNFTGGLAELPVLSALALDNLSLDQLTTLTNSLGSLTALPLTSLGDLLNAVDTGAISEVLAGCSLQDALAASDITSPSQLPAGPLTDLLAALVPFDLDGLLDLNSILAGLDGLGLDSFGDLLGGLQGGSILPADLADLFLGGLASAGLPGPLQSVADVAAPGLAAVLDQLSGGLPGGLDNLLPADLLDIVNGVSDSNSMGSTDPLEAVLGGLTGALSGDAASALTDTVLGALIGGAPDLFADGLAGLLGELGTQLPNGLADLPAADILDLANALNAGNLTNSTAPVTDVLSGIAGGSLDAGAITSVLDTVLGLLGGLGA